MVSSPFPLKNGGSYSLSLVETNGYKCKHLQQLGRQIKRKTFCHKETYIGKSCVIWRQWFAYGA